MIQAILLDVEGTTTPIEFVHKTLFPFSLERMSEFVAENCSYLEKEFVILRDEHTRERDPIDFLPLDSPSRISVYLKYLISSDRKSTPLKSIQGKIWQSGYDSGILRSEVFHDVPEAFERWTVGGKKISIYSSGSVLAQRSLFRYTVHGDLSPYITNYFDTHIGGKRIPDSYLRICRELHHLPADVIFVSDVPAELKAAREAGLATVLAIRPGNSPVAPIDHWNYVNSFDDIDTYI